MDIFAKLIWEISILDHWPEKSCLNFGIVRLRGCTGTTVNIINLLHLSARTCCSPVTTLCRF